MAEQDDPVMDIVIEAETWQAICQPVGASAGSGFVTVQMHRSQVLKARDAFGKAAVD